MLGLVLLWPSGSPAVEDPRDHIASTIHTVVLACSGATISVLLLLYFYERLLRADSHLSLVSTEEIAEEIAEEIVRTLASGIGLALAVPLPNRDRRPHRPGSGRCSPSVSPGGVARWSPGRPGHRSLGAR